MDVVIDLVSRALVWDLFVNNILERPITWGLQDLDKISCGLDLGYKVFWP
jgi:hypothetical protein